MKFMYGYTVCTKYIKYFIFLEIAAILKIGKEGFRLSNIYGLEIKNVQIWVAKPSVSEMWFYV